MPDADRAALAAAVGALALGAMAALAMVAGHARWDGRVILTLGGTHGVHAGDLLAVVPILVSIWLARWCLRR